MQGLPGYDSFVRGINKALCACGMKKNRDWIGAGIYLAIVVSVTIGSVAFAWNQIFDGNDIPPKTTQNIDSISVEGTNNAPITNNSNNNIYNEFPETEFSYHVNSPSVKRNDGYWLTDISFKQVNIPGIEPELSINFATGTFACRQIRDANTFLENDHIKGAKQITTVGFECLSPTPVDPEDKNLFWLE